MASSVYIFQIDDHDDCFTFIVGDRDTCKPIFDMLHSVPTLPSPKSGTEYGQEVQPLFGLKSLILVD